MRSSQKSGIAQFQRGMGKGFDDVPEAAWRVLADRRGQGLAAEAMTGVLDWFDGSFELPRTVCLIQESNSRSLKVAERLGYRRSRTGAYRNQPAFLLERHREKHLT